LTEGQFAKSISLSYMGYNTMQVIGPAIAAGVIGLTHGPRPAFLFDAATFATGFVMTWTIQVAHSVRKNSPSQFLRDLRSGVLFLWKNAAVRYLSGYHVIFTIVTAASTLGIILY